jgi:hypothetical protein
MVLSSGGHLAEVCQSISGEDVPCMDNNIVQIRSNQFQEVVLQYRKLQIKTGFVFIIEDTFIH